MGEEKKTLTNAMYSNYKLSAEIFVPQNGDLALSKIFQKFTTGLDTWVRKMNPGLFKPH